METIMIYCDGGCRGNQNTHNIGGYGIVIQHGEIVKEFYGATENTTNNRMELLACIESLKKLKDMSIPVVLTTDSRYVERGVNEWRHSWARRGWKNSQGKPVGNLDLWKELLWLVDRHDDITFEHCYGHSDNEGNNRADYLVNVAMDEFLERRDSNE